MDLKSMKRKELQSLCKKHGIAANLATSLMIEKLESVLEIEQQNKRKGCLKRSGESTSENLGVSQKNVTFVVEESKEVDEKPQRVSKRKTARASTEISTSEKSVTEPVKRTTRSRGDNSSENLGASQKNVTSVVEESKEVDEKPQRVSKRNAAKVSTEISTSESSVAEAAKRSTRSKGLAESVLWSPVIEKKKVKAKGESSRENAEENVTRSLRTRSVTVNDTDLKGGRKRKVGELKEEIASKTAEPSRSTRRAKKSDDEDPKGDVKVASTKGAQSGNTSEKEEGDANKDVLPNRSRSTRNSKKLDEIEDENVGDDHGKKRRKIDNVVVESAPANIIESAPATRSTRISSVLLDVGTCVFNVGKASEKGKGLGTKALDKKKGQDTKATRSTRSKVAKIEEDNALPIAEKPGKGKSENQTKGAVVKPKITRGSSKPLEPIAEAKEVKNGKAKKQEDVVSHAKRPTRGALKASEDVTVSPASNTPVEKPSNLKSVGQSIKKSAAADKNVTAPSGRSTRSASKNVDDLDSSPALGSGQKSRKQASKALTETENVTSPTSRSIRSTVEVVESEINSPKIETGHTSVSTVLSPAPSRATRTASKVFEKATVPLKGGKHVSTPKTSTTKSSSKPLEDVPKKNQSATKETAEDVTTEVAMTSSRRSTRKPSKGSAEEADSHKPSKTSKMSASEVGGVQKTNDDEQTSIARKSLRSSSKQGNTDAGKSTGKKRTREAVTEEDSSMLQRKRSKLDSILSKSSHKELPDEGKASGIIDSGNKQLTESEALESDEVTKIDPLEAAAVKESEAGNILDQNDVPETGPPEIDHEKPDLKSIDDSVDLFVNEVTENKPLESATSTETKAEIISEQYSVPESKPSHLDNLDDANTLNLGIDASVDRITETEHLESATVTEADAGDALTETKAENILEQNNLPESMASHLDNLEDANGLDLGFIMDAPVEDVTEAEHSESVTVTEPEATVTEVAPVDEVTEVEPLVSATVVEPEAAVVEPEAAVTVTESTVTVTETTVTETETTVTETEATPRPTEIEATPTETEVTLTETEVTLTETEVTLTETEAENILDQIDAPGSRLSHLDNIVDMNGMNMGSGIEETVETIPLESATVTVPEAGNILDQSSVPESRPSQLDNLEGTDGLNLGSDINENSSPEIDLEMILLKGKIVDESKGMSVDNELKDICTGPKEPVPESVEGIGGSSENILEINEASKIDDTMLYDINVEESELEEGSEATDVYFSPCSPNLIQAASPMIEVTTFNMDTAAPAETPNTLCKVSEDFGIRSDDLGDFSNLERKLGTETEISYEGNEATTIDDLPASSNVINSGPSDGDIGEPITAVNTLNLSQTTLGYNDCSVEAEQTPFEIGICKADTVEQLCTPSLTKEFNFTSEAESPTQKIDSQLCLEEIQKVEKNTVSAKENSSSAFAKEVSENIEEMPKSADVSINLEKGESSMEHIDELRDAVVDDALPECITPEKIQHETEVCKEDLEIPSSTQLPTNVQDTETIRGNFVTTEDSNSSVPEERNSENFDDLNPSNFVDISMNIGVGDSSVQMEDKLSDPNVEEMLPRSSIPGSSNNENTAFDINFEEKPVSPKNNSNFDGDGDTIMKELNDSRQETFDYFNPSDELSKNQDESLWQQYSVSISREETTQENISSFKDKDDNSKEVYIEDNNTSINFDIGINLSPGDSLPTPTNETNFEDNTQDEKSFEDNTQDETNFEDNTQDETSFEDNTQDEKNFEDNTQDETNFEDNTQVETHFEDNTQDESNRYQDTFENIDETFMIEETWVSSSSVVQTQDSVNDTTAHVNQEENTERFDQAEGLRNTSVISDVDTQGVCSQGIGISDIDNVFRDFEASISATHVTREERATSVHETIQVSDLNMENENTEINPSSAIEPSDQEQRKAADQETYHDHDDGGFSF